MKSKVLKKPYLEISENLHKLSEEVINSDEWIEEKIFAFLLESGKHTDIFEKHLRYKSKTNNGPGII